MDRVWGYGQEKKVFGDMGFSFQESADTRSYDIPNLIKASSEYCFTDLSVEEKDVFNAEDQTFPIYEIWEAEIELTWEGEALWAGNIVPDTTKLLEVHVCATKEQAGWVEEVDAFKNVKIRYRNA